MNSDTSSNTDSPGAYYNHSRRALLIADVAIDDPVVLGEIRHWATGQRGPVCDDEVLAQADLTAFCRQAIGVGAVAIRGAGGVQEAHHLDHLISEVSQRTADASQHAASTTTAAAAAATTAMTKATSEAQRNLLAAGKVARDELTEHVDHARQALEHEIQRLVGGDDPVLGAKLATLLQGFGTQLDERINRRTDELFTKAARQLDPRDPTSPLAEFTKGIGQQHTALTERLDAGQKSIQESLDRLTTVVHTVTAATAATAALTSISPLKGGVYQDVVHEQLQQLASSVGDEYVDTSSMTGLISRCRKGDGLLIVPHPSGHGAGRIVVEMTDSDTTRRQWTEYLDEAERNRDAVASLGLVRTVEQMPGGDRLRVFGPRRIVLAHDPGVDDPSLLRAAVQLLRGQATLTSTRSGAEHLHTAHEKLTEATNCLERLTEVQKAAGSIRKGADKIDGDCAWMHTSLQRLLSEATAALAIRTGGDDAAAAA